MPLINLNSICGANQGAIAFLEAWGLYLRAVDNVVDKGEWNDASVLNALALGNQCYSTAFYHLNADYLKFPILAATGVWGVSAEWERSEQELWKRQWADVMRHADVGLIQAVSLICMGSWNHAQAMVRIFLSAAYIDHKDRHGTPWAERIPESVSEPVPVEWPVCERPVSEPSAMTALIRICAGEDQLAAAFLEAFGEYLEEVAVFLGEKEKHPATFIRVCALTNMVFSMPYYRLRASKLSLSAVESLRTRSITPLFRAVATLSLGFQRAGELVI